MELVPPLPEADDLATDCAETQDRERPWRRSNARSRVVAVDTGIWLGLGISFAGWIGSCHIEYRITRADTCYGTLYAFLPTLAVGALVGWHVDVRMQKTLYEAPAARVTVPPLVSRDRAGAMASVTW